MYFRLGGKESAGCNTTSRAVSIKNLSWGAQRGDLRGKNIYVTMEGKKKKGGETGFQKMRKEKESW